MIREVYTNRDILPEELAAWAFFVSGVVMFAAVQQELLGLLMMVVGGALTYHAHRRAFFRYVERSQEEDGRRS